MSAPDTYAKPPHGWTCFHCGETFTTVGGARDHFGATPDADPGCMIRVQLGEERGLQMALRKAEAELERYRCEDSDMERTVYQMKADHSIALREQEEKGYARGLADGRREALGQTEEQQMTDHHVKLVRAADKHITAIHDAFGAPGDYGYSSRQGKALYELYKFQVELYTAINEPESQAAWDSADAVRLIADERRRQVEVEGWTPEHDDGHTSSELARAAACYAIKAGQRCSVPGWWPWDDDWWKPKDEISDLVRAGALIVAEIERVRRAERRAENTLLEDGDGYD